MPRQGLRRAARPIFPSEDGASGSTSRDGPRLAHPTRRHSERELESEESGDEFNAEDLGDLDDDDLPDDIEEHGLHDGIQTRSEDEEGDEEEEDDEEQDDDDDEELKYISAPLPPNLREISSLASWTVSTYKPGSGVAALRHPSPSQFWQSDGPQPHTLTLHFFKRVSIVRIRVYLDFGLDESYTPTKMIFLAGMGGNDLVEFATWQGESPCGWVDVSLDGVGGGHGQGHDQELKEGWRPKRHHHQRRRQRRYMRLSQDGQPVEASLTDIETSNNEVFVVYEGEDPNDESSQRRYVQGLDDCSDLDQYEQYQQEADGPYSSYDEDEDDLSAGNVLKAMVLQVKVCENHQNGKDTHVRGFQVYARDDKYFARRRRNSTRKSLRGSGIGAKAGGVPEMHDLANDLSQLESEHGGDFMARFKESDWLMEPELR